MKSQSKIYKATPKPWKLPRNHPWWHPKNDLLHVPRALKREKWTEAEWKRHREAQQRRRSFVQTWHTVVKKDEEIFAKVRARKAEKEARYRKQLERAERKAERQQRRIQKAEEAGRVLRYIEKGTNTTRRIMKALDFDKRTVRRAIRLLLKKERIKKTSAKTYAPYWEEKTAQPIRRKRLPKRLQRKRL